MGKPGETGHPCPGPGFGQNRAEVERVVRAKLRQTVRLFSSDDTLLVEGSPGETRVLYVSSRTSPDGGAAAQLECRLHASGVMWIGEVEVAAEFRSRGVGRRLVTAAENAARELCCRSIHVFPLVPAQRFWERLGYRPHRRTSRVMVKDVRNPG